MVTTEGETPCWKSNPLVNGSGRNGLGWGYRFVAIGTISCVNHFVKATCGAFVAAAGDVPVCDPRTFHECVLPTQASYVRENEAERCDCGRQCRRLIYQPTVSQSLLADSAANYFKHAYDLPGTLDVVIADHCIVEVGIPANFNPRDDATLAPVVRPKVP